MVQRYKNNSKLEKKSRTVSPANKTPAPFFSPSNLIFPTKQANGKSIKQQTNLNKKKCRIYISNIQYHEKFKKN
jgi:hypothetical protein